MNDFQILRAEIEVLGLKIEKPLST